MRRAIALQTVLIVLASAVVTIGVDTQPRGDNVTHRLNIPDSLMGRLAHGKEARDEQEIVSFSPGLISEGTRQLVATKIATWGSILPNDSLSGWTQDDDFASGHLVAGVSLEGGDIKTLFLYEHSTNAIWLYFVNGEWTARVNKDPSMSLKVTRYTYAGLLDNAFPVTARWDWEGSTPTTPVLGIRCARAWCLVGTATSSTGPDPYDHYIGGPMPIPVYRRVRGWYDRKINTAGGGSIFLYPGPETSQIDSDGGFKGTWRHMLSIKLDGVASEVNVEITKKWWLGKWKARRKNGAGSELDVDHIPYSTMPAAARWSSSHIRLPIPAFLVSRTATNFGLAWVRCASGCCSGELIM